MIDAAFAGAVHDIRLKELDVTCGDERIFSSASELVVPAANEAISAFESHPDKYGIHYDEEGVGGGERGHIIVDSAHGRCTVWRDAFPAFRVEIAMEEKSEPVDLKGRRAEGAEPEKGRP